MKNNGGVIVPGQPDSQATSEQVLMAHLAQQGQINRELAAMFAATLRIKHQGKVFLPTAIAEECYGDASKDHGWLVMITNLGPLGTYRVQAYTPDEQPYVPPVEEPPGSAREWLRLEIDKGHVPVLGSLPQALLIQIAQLMEQYSEFAGKTILGVAQPGASPEPMNEPSKEVCSDDWHKHGVGLRCPTCGSKERVEAEAISA